MLAGYAANWRVCLFRHAPMAPGRGAEPRYSVLETDALPLSEPGECDLSREALDVLDSLYSTTASLFNTA